MPEQVSHPLHNSWCIWEHRDEKGSSYGDNLHLLCTYSTVEEFWGYWNNIPSPSHALFDGITPRRFVNRTVQSFSVFKKGIRPEWEDPQNSVGAEWAVRKRFNGPSLDELWTKLILGLIGETIDPDDEVTGARVIHKNRKDTDLFRFEIWLRSRDLAKADQIREAVLECMNSGSTSQKLNSRDWAYKKHSD
jgi:translation initiation factor 4E